MTLNVPYKIRAGLYITTAIGSPVIAYLLARGIISGLEVTLWAALVTVVNSLAALNTTPTEDEA